MVKLPELDGAQMKDRRTGVPVHPPGAFPYGEVVRLKGDPFLIRYDAAAGGAATLPWHKDNADVSFIVLLNSPADFDGGGTHFEALGTLGATLGQALVFNGQLPHRAAPITRGQRWVMSGFTFFSQDYLQMKRLGTLATLPYHN